MTGLAPGFWRGRSVFVTGHTGFKGGWLVTWLAEMGADVCGYALSPVTKRSYFVLCDLKRKVKSVIGDVRDVSALTRSMQSAQPDMVIHLAAQPLVRHSYHDPLATFETNVMGTANLLDAMRRTPSVRAAVIVTSDKCYYPYGISSGYREQDRLGGIDPYSSSKACAELVVDAYIRSFFERSETPVAVATVRAGNVIGGGDWADDRIVPDAIRALERAEPLTVRNPDSVRPWQHVLEPLAGYLMLARKLSEDGLKFAGAWNFGPGSAAEITVGELADLLIAYWGKGSWRHSEEQNALPETAALGLNSTKALCELGWSPRLSIEETIRLTIDWYRRAICAESGDMYAFSAKQIQHYDGPMTNGG
jgi:CDP-glucose 4,6-dehydratase